MSETVLERAPARAARRRPAPPSEALLYTLLAVMVLFWSANYIVGKIALREFPALLLGGLRTAVAGAIILPAYLWSLRRGRPRWSRSDLPVLLFLGLVGVALNQVFFILGLSRTSVAHASILIGLTPILVLLIAAAVGLERITRGKVAGMTIALAGVALLNAAPSKGPHASALGNGFILLGALAFAVFTVVGKRVAHAHGSLTVSTFAYAGGALMLAPVTLWQSAGFDYSRVSLTGWASLIYMAAFPSVVCYLIFYWALTHVSASRVAAFAYLQPLLATLMAVPLLGEPVTLSLMAGGALVFAGVYATERRSGVSGERPPPPASGGKAGRPGNQETVTLGFLER